MKMPFDVEFVQECAIGGYELTDNDTVVSPIGGATKNVAPMEDNSLILNFSRIKNARDVADFCGIHGMLSAGIIGTKKESVEVWLCHAKLARREIKVFKALVKRDHQVMKRLVLNEGENYNRLLFQLKSGIINNAQFNKTLDAAKQRFRRRRSVELERLPFLDELAPITLRSYNNDIPQVEIKSYEAFGESDENYLLDVTAQEIYDTYHVRISQSLAVSVDKEYNLILKPTSLLGALWFQFSLLMTNSLGRLYQCSLMTCRRLYVPKRSDQKYCTPEHRIRACQIRSMQDIKQ